MRSNEFPHRPYADSVRGEGVRRGSSANRPAMKPERVARARSDLDLIIAVSLGCVVIFLLGVATVLAPDTAATRLALFTATLASFALMAAFIWRRYRRRDR